MSVFIGLIIASFLTLFWLVTHRLFNRLATSWRVALLLLCVLMLIVSIGAYLVLDAMYL